MPMARLLSEIESATDFIPYYMHSFCRILGRITEESRKIDKHDILEAKDEWAKDEMSYYIGKVSGFMNARKSKSQLRDKVLYVIGNRITEKYFKSSDVHKSINDTFPGLNIQRSNVTAALNELCGNGSASDSLPSDPLLTMISQKGNSVYLFKGPGERIATAFALDRQGSDVILTYEIG